MNRPRISFIKLLFAIVLLSFYPISLIAQPGFESLGFKHNWELKMLEHGFQLLSKSPAPVPFSMNGEPQASMVISASKLDLSTKINLEDIMKDEVAGINNDLIIDEYLEDDFTPKDNIVSYTDILAGNKIAVIKYRTKGDKRNPAAMSRSIRHILFIKDNMLYISTVIVLYAEDQDNIRNDQIKLVEYILNK
jgi:hypothetical protein